MKNRNYRAAKIRSASFNESDNTIEVIWSTGADVVRSDYDGDYIERLSMDPGAVRLGRLNSGAPFLDTHNSYGLENVIGSILPGSARIEDGKGIATIRLSSAASDSDTVQKIREGVVCNCSVGYWTHASTRSDDDLPVVTVTDWEPLEISAVPIPADAGAQIRLAGKRRHQPLSKEEREYEAGAARAAKLLGKPAPRPVPKKPRGLIEVAKREAAAARRAKR